MNIDPLVIKYPITEEDLKSLKNLNLDEKSLLFLCELTAHGWDVKTLLATFENCGNLSNFFEFFNWDVEKVKPFIVKMRQLSSMHSLEKILTKNHIKLEEPFC